MKAIISLIIFLTLTIQLSAQWTQQYTNYSGLSFYSIFMIDESNGFVVGSKIYGTTNGGEDWFNVPETFPNLYSVWFPASNIGVAVGKDGKIVKTTDGGSSQGETWVEKPCPESDGLFKEIYFLNNEVGWAVGYKDNGSIIVKTTDGGENWQILNSGVDDCRLETVFFLNENLGWVGGLRDYFGSPKVVILKTTNGGDTWISQISNKLGNIHSIRMCDENVGWAVGLGDLFGNQYGLNYETTDGGNSWMHRTAFDDIHMNSIFFLNPTTGWGNSLVSVYKYQTATDVYEISSIPQQYNLSQNYPNPFNPTTTINYQIPELSLVTLTVYDVLGNEVATLVNEEKAVGSYEVEFDASNLPSGIYFYRIQAGDPSKGSGQGFIETRKMVLLK